MTRTTAGARARGGQHERDPEDNADGRRDVEPRLALEEPGNPDELRGRDDTDRAEDDGHESQSPGDAVHAGLPRLRKNMWVARSPVTCFTHS